MNDKALFLALSFVLAGALLIGCSEESAAPGEESPPPGVTNETEAMKAMATADAFVLNEDQTFRDESLQPTDYSASGRVAGEIIPISWGRFVENVTVTATTTMDEGDSIATVNVVRDITGTFRILAKQTQEDTSVVLIEKPFGDQSVRNVIFKRVARDPERFWLNWVPIATSLVAGKTVTPPEDQVVMLTEVQFMKPNGDTIVVTDPTNFYLRYPWRDLPHRDALEDVPEMSFGQMFTVRATLVSTSPDTDIVALKYGFSAMARGRIGMPLISQTKNGDGTFTRVYQVPAEARHHPGFFHAGVLALSHKTLFDDDVTNYSVNWWGVPYRML
jgi:hypothetical protein